MGNNPSSDGHVGARAGRAFGRSTGALGLSKTELDRRCQPSGLYPSCQWEERAVRRQIADGRLAARLRGSDTRKSMSMRECPICFLHYAQVNMTQCCQANICTECYLQVRPQKEKNCICPFCNSNKLVIRVAKAMDAAAVQERQKNEQAVLEAKIRARANTAASDTTDSSEGFGSSLDKSPSVRLMRKRSESLSFSEQDAPADADSLSSLAMTEEDRHKLEEEMKAQHTHPLARRLEYEAEERRIQNEREYYRSRSGRLREVQHLRSQLGRQAAAGSSRRSGGGSRNWNEIVDAYENSGGGGVNSLDDLVVLEAAILLSMEEEARRNAQDGSAEAAAASNFDPSQHAASGFPLVQERFHREDAASLPDSSRRSRARRQLLTGLGNSLLRGISEAEQIEMAIALSMQEAQEQDGRNSSDQDSSSSHASSGSGSHSTTSDGGDYTAPGETVEASTPSSHIEQDGSSQDSDHDSHRHCSTSGSEQDGGNEEGSIHDHEGAVASTHSRTSGPPTRSPTEDADTSANEESSRPES